MAAANPYPLASQPNGRYGESPIHSKSMASIPSVAELQTRARAEIRLSKYSSLDTLFAEAVRSNKSVNAMLENRPESAYIEWIKADLYISMVMHNADAPFMIEKRKDIFSQIQRLHASQQSDVKEVEDKIRHAHSQASKSNGVASAATSSGSNSTYGSATATNGQRPRTVYEAAIPPQPNGRDFRPSYATRPMSSPVDDPLLDRFRRMRAREPSAKGQVPSSIPESLRTARPATPGSNTNGAKPTGPRPMPVDKELPTTPPRLNIPALLDSLPRAPSPIYTPIKGAQNPDATPPRSSSMAYVNPRANRPERRPFRELATPYIEAEDLFGRLKEFKILLIDVRPRNQFDEGHVHHRHIICVEPFSLQHPLSIDQLRETPMLYAPEDETALLERLPEFDLIVYYDQNTSDPQFLIGNPQPHISLCMRYLHDAFIEFNEDVSLQRDPVFLLGGLDAWVDLVSQGALQSSTTGPTNTIKRKPAHRNSLVGSQSARDVRYNRLASFAPMTPDEDRKWREKAQNESSQLPALPDYQTRDGESMASQAARETFVPIHSVSELFTQPQHPHVQRQSMTSPTYPQYPPPQRRAPPPPPPLASGGMPLIPSRPAPIASRPSYSGVSDHRALSQAPPRSNDAPALYQPTMRSHMLHKTGLYNFGSTCYMNSVLQCLSATIPLTVFFLRDDWERQVVKNWQGSSGIMPRNFYNLMRALETRDENGNNRTIRPSSLRGFCARLNPQWGNEGQQDAQEFLLFILDVLHEDFNARWQTRPLKELTPDEERYRERLAPHLASKKEWQRSMHNRQSFIDSLFLGQWATQLTCQKCKSTFTTHQVWTGLQVPIPPGSRTSVQNCLKLFCQGDRIDGYNCSKCKQPTTVIQTTKLTRLPNILVISFNRYTGNTQQKRDTSVDFPLTSLDMQPFMADTMPRDGEGRDPAVTPPFTYDLYAVVRHIGADARSGHYKAVCKDPGRRKWREFDDARITDYDLKSDSRSFLDPKQAYILFYERSVPR